MRHATACIGVVAEAAEMAARRWSVASRAGELADGSYLAPSIVAVEQLDSSFVQEEFFGPVMNLERFGNDAEAVSKANATRYGLPASVWTARPRARPPRRAQCLRSGTVWINDHNRLVPRWRPAASARAVTGGSMDLKGSANSLATKHIWQAHGTSCKIQPA